MKIYPLHIPAGNDTEFQYNNGGIFGGTSGATYNDGTGVSTFTGLIVDGTIATGLDMSGGTFATAVQNWPTTPVIQANSVRLLKSDATNNNIILGEGAFANDDGLRNIGIGGSAGNLNDTTGGGINGTENVYVGHRAGEGNTGTNTGGRNVFIGYLAGFKNQSADQNVGLGKSTLEQNLTSPSNMAIGKSALAALVSGNGENVAIGTSCLITLATGRYNVNIGSGSGQNLTGASESNVGIGKDTLRGGAGVSSGNIGIGFDAGRSVNGAFNNVFIGKECGRLLTSGDFNVFLGGRAGWDQTTISNTLIIDNQDRTSAALELTNALIVGTFNATVASQTLRINGNLGVNSTPTIPLDINAKSGMTSIGGFAVKVTNQTGAVTVVGQLVKADTATDDAVILTAAGDDECFGVFLESGVADGSEAWIVVAGIADVAMEDNTAATHGNWVETSDVEAGYADATSATPAAAPAHFEEIGHCIESVAAGGAGTHILARCVLHFN